MQLTENQIISIKNFLKSKGVKWDDLQMELIDHFANILEKKSLQNPQLDLQKESMLIYQNFGDKGFKNLIKEKQKALNIKNWKQILRYFKIFFSFPKILITVSVFILLYYIYQTASDKILFFNFLNTILLVVSFTSLVTGISIIQYNNKETLLLNSIKNLFLAVNSFGIIFNSINIFSKNINNYSFDLFRIIIFEIFIIFSIATFSVYKKAKKQTSMLNI